MTIYLDYNATSPVLPEVADLVYKLMVEEYGNAGSHTHAFGADANNYVEVARKKVADVVGASKSEVTFTSGATESNNIAILGLERVGNQKNRRHIITSTIEHKAVLEPIAELSNRGFDVTYIEVDESGVINSEDIERALREDTLLVSIMHINNETGCIQPINSICDILANHEAYFHVDAAQSFGKLIGDLENQRIDMISASGHKVYAPKGVGALIARKRGDYKVKIPLQPLVFGGGQERGLRPGTLPVQLIAGFGLACEIAMKNCTLWQEHANKIKTQLTNLIDEFNGVVVGDNTSPFVVNFYIPEIKSKAAIVILKDIIAISNGSACTSSSSEPSHVLTAMGLSKSQINSAIRISWSHSTIELPIEAIKEKLCMLL